MRRDEKGGKLAGDDFRPATRRDTAGGARPSFSTLEICVVRDTLHPAD